jgi:putative transport protein
METSPVAWAVLILSAVAASGLALAGLKFKGVGMGIAGVLFAGILFGHFGFYIEKEILEFVREFGLILFVYTIGLQLGPGFFASLRKQGLKLNLLAIANVLLGVAVCVGVAHFILKIDIITSVGLLCGAVTNTPGLGAATGALKSIGGESASQASLPAVAYAVAYPGGVCGIILTLMLIRAFFRIDPEKEAALFREEQKKGHEALERVNLVVANPGLEGQPISEIPGRHEAGIVVSRIRRAGGTEVQTATEQTILHVGDTVLVVGTRKGLAKTKVAIGQESDVNLLKIPGRIVNRKLLVTHKEVLGKNIDELDFDDIFGVTVTRVTRADMEMTAVPDLTLQFGDVIQVVGDEDSIKKVEKVVGNSLKALNETHFVPIFLGIALGVIAGVIPIAIPGLPVPVKLGIAGGPLVLAIILSRIGRIGPLVWHMPANANLAFREMGIVLFLACVGLKAGETFFAQVFSANGPKWLLAGLLITVVPLLVVGLFARGVLKLNYTSICGVLSGAMTDPPALAFANAITKSDSPAVAYATVYPTTMLLRILTAQTIILIFCAAA